MHPVPSAARALLASALLAACASAPAHKPLEEAKIEVAPKQEVVVLPAPHTSGGRFDPKSFAANAYSAGECSTQAKELYQLNRDNGWAGLRGCVERGKFARGNFTDLRGVLNGPWVEDLKSLPDVPEVFARIVALRGGDVDGDLKTLQVARVPLFSLQAAMAQPEVYKGRYLLLRAEIEQSRAKSDGASMRLAEQTLQGKMLEGEVAGDRRGSKSSGKADYSASVTTSRYGDAKGSLSVNRRGESREAVTRTVYDNQLTKTGRVSVGRMLQPDPFLEPGKSYVFLVRFDGVRKTPGKDDEEAEETPIVSIVGYYPPAAMLVD